MDLQNTIKYLENYGKNITSAYRSLSQYNKVSFKVVRFGEIATLELNLGEYWKWIENGRKPGKMPPIDRLIKWVNKKGLRSNKRSIRSIAFAIGKLIAKRGLKPKNYLKRSSQSLPDFKQGLNEAFKKDLEIFNNTLKLKSNG